MKFNLQDALHILERTPHVLSCLLKNLPDCWTQQNEGGDSWTAYDVIGHFIHGEKTDWIPRLKIILRDGDKRFVPFDRLAQFRDSKGKSMDELLQEFAVIRKKNIEELIAIAPDEELLEKTGIHPQFGSVSLRQLLAAWVVHDLTHIDQVSRVMAKQYAEEVGPWKAYMGILNK
jgi:hypothetical protein